MAKLDPTGTRPPRPLPNQRPGSNPMLRAPGFTTPLNLGALATKPMGLIGAPGVPATPAAAPRTATKEGLGPTGPTNTGSMAGSLGRMIGGAIKPALAGVVGGAANAGAQMASNPVQTLQAVSGGPSRPSQPQAAPGTFRAANNPNNAYGGGGGINMNIPNPALTAASMIGAQNSAMNSAVGQGNNTLVSGGLSSVTGPSGGLQNPGLYTAAYNNSPKAQQSIGAMGDVGDARWRANMGPGDTYTDQGQVIRGGAGGSASTGNAGASGSGSAAGGGTSPTNPASQLLDPLVAQYQDAMNAANASNQQRYDQGLGNLAAQRARAEADLARMGQSRAQEIRDGARRAEAQGMQNLTARGLANTTNLPTMQRGVARDANRAMTALGDAMAQNRYNQDRQMTGDLNQWIYNKDDQAPNFDTLANLALGLAQAQVQPPAFDINDVLSKLGSVPSISDLLAMMPQLQGGQLQQPYMQYPNLPAINFPQGAAGNAGAQGQAGAAGGGAQGGRPFQMNGSNDTSGGAYGGNLGGAGLALGGYGLTQAIPYLSGGLNQFIQNPGSTIAGAGNSLGNLIASGVRGANGAIGQGLGWLNGMGNQLAAIGDPNAPLPEQNVPTLAGLIGSFFR